MRCRTGWLPLIGLLTVAGVCLLSGTASGLKSASSHRTPPEQSSTGSPSAVSQAPNQQVIESYGKLPLSFEPCLEANCGETNGDARFLSRGPGYTMFLTPTEAVLVLQKSEGRGHESEDKSPNGVAGSSVVSRHSSLPGSVLRMQIVGANPEAQITGIDPLPGKSNYFIGNDPAKWRTNVPNYSKVQYKDVYPGIDLFYYGNPHQLEYDFVVAPGADPNAIRLAFDGADKLELEECRRLLAEAPVRKKARKTAAKKK